MQMPPGGMGAPQGRPPMTPNPIVPGAPMGPPGGAPPAAGAPPGAAPPGGALPPTSPLSPSPSGPPGLPLAGGAPGGSGGDAGAKLRSALKQAGIDLPEDPALEQRDLGRRSPRGSADHIYEIVAQDLADWLNKMPKILAAAMRGGPKRQGPFKHAATGQQKYEIYKAKLFNEDDSPNMEGRQELLRKMTPQQYAQVVHIVTREMRRGNGERGLEAPAEAENG